ncbi:MAG: hypothetical protein AB7J28_09640 [Hyphomonadaceae bacterium]
MLVLFAIVLVLVVAAAVRPSIFTHSTALSYEECLTAQQRAALEADADARNDHAPITISKSIGNYLGLGQGPLTLPVVYRREASKGIAWLPNGSIFLMANVSLGKREPSPHYFHVFPDGRVEGICRMQNHNVRHVTRHQNALEQTKAEIDFWREEADRLGVGTDQSVK